MPVSPLCEWVAFYKPPSSPPASVSLRICVANVVRMAFPTELDESAHDWDAILHVLNNHATELNLVQPLRSELLHEHYDGMLGSLQEQNPPHDAELELERTLSALCVGAFKGAHQASFVNDVLSLSEHIQLTLFTLLREDEDSEAISGDGAPSNSPSKTRVDQHAPSTPVQPTRQASSASATPASSCSKNEMKRMARENRILKEENAALQADLVQAKDAMAALHDADEKRKDDFENLKLELRVDAAKNERAIKKQVDEYVAHLQDELTKATTKLQSLSGIVAELAAARDELDILKPAADKAAKLEARVEKYQAKLDEMTRVKESNKRLEEKTAELSEKALAQEVQLQKLLTVQRKLDETKESMANLAVRCSELDELVGRRDHEKHALAADLESARQELAMQMRLKHDMQATIDQLQDTLARGGGSLSAPAIEHLVDGDLQDEVEALRRQVAQLEGQLSLESATRVDALGEDLDIMARVKKSFETKYFDSQRVVEQLEAELAASKDQLDALKAQHDLASSDLAASIADCAAVQSDFSSAKDAWAARDEQWRSSDAALQDKLAVEHQHNVDRMRAIELLQTEKDDLTQALTEQQAATASVEAAREELKVEVLDLTVNLADTITKLEDQEQRHVTLLIDLDTTKELWMAESNEFAAFKVVAEADRAKLDEMTAKHDDLERDIARLRHDLDLNESQRTILEHVRFDNENDLATLRSNLCDVEASLLEATEAWHMADEDGAVWRQMKADDRDQWARDRAAFAKEADLLAASHAEARVAWAAELQEAKNETDVQRRVAQDTHDALDAKVQAMEEEAAHAKAAHDRRVDELEQAQQELADKVATFCVREKRGQEVLRELKTKYAADAQAMEDQIQLLEVQTSRLEAKNRMLEKDRAHHSLHDKRHVSAEHEAVSLKMEMQLNALKAELDALGKEHKALQSKVHLCTCNLTCDPSMKGYVDSIKHMEMQQQADSERRRELILLNAKLVQEQKQLVLCTTSQAQEIQKLKDVTNRLRLREERRTKAMEKENTGAGGVESPRQLLSPSLKRKLDETTATPTTQTTPSGAKRSRTTASPQPAAKTTQRQSSATGKTLLQPSSVAEDAPAQCSQQ